MRSLSVLFVTVSLGTLVLWFALAEPSSRGAATPAGIRTDAASPPGAALQPAAPVANESRVAPERHAAPPAQEPEPKAIADEVTLGLHGVVLGDRNAPLGGARVGIDVWQSDMDGGPVIVLTDHDGRFRFAPLPPGPHRLEVRASGYGRAGCTVELPADERRELRLALNRPGIVRGVVLDAHGRPVSGVRLFLRDERAALTGRIDFGVDAIERALAHIDTSDDWPQDQTPRACSDTHGRFEIALDAESVRLQAAAAAGCAPSEPLALTLLSGEEREGVVLALRPGCTLRGRALNGDGRPVVGALSYRAEDGSRFEFDSGADGRFEARALPPGRGTLGCGPVLARSQQGSLTTTLSAERDGEVVLQLTPLERVGQAPREK